MFVIVAVYRTLKTYVDSFKEPLKYLLTCFLIVIFLSRCNRTQKMNSLVLIGTQYEMPKYLLKMQNLIFRIMPCSAFEKMGFQKTDFINLCKSMTELNFKHELKKISCSVLVVCGDKDKINKKASLELQQQIENAEIAIIENAGHEVNTDNPTLLGQKLNVFFRTICLINNFISIHTKQLVLGLTAFFLLYRKVRFLSNF